MAATNNNTDAEHRPDPTLSIQNRLRLTARVAVGVSLLGSIALLVTFFLLLFPFILVMYRHLLALFCVLHFLPLVIHLFLQL